MDPITGGKDAAVGNTRTDRDRAESRGGTGGVEDAAVLSQDQHASGADIDGLRVGEAGGGAAELDGIQARGHDAASALPGEVDRGAAVDGEADVGVGITEDRAAGQHVGVAGVGYDVMAL